MFEPINLPKLTEEYRSAIGPLLNRIADYDKKIATMSNSTEKHKMIKRRAGLWGIVLDTQATIRELEVSMNAGAEN